MGSLHGEHYCGLPGTPWTWKRGTSSFVSQPIGRHSEMEGAQRDHDSFRAGSSIGMCDSSGGPWRRQRKPTGPPRRADTRVQFRRTYDAPLRCTPIPGSHATCGRTEQATCRHDRDDQPGHGGGDARARHRGPVAARPGDCSGEQADRHAEEAEREVGSVEAVVQSGIDADPQLLGLRDTRCVHSHVPPALGTTPSAYFTDGAEAHRQAWPQ